MLTGIVDLYAVIVVGAACAVPTEKVEARITTIIKLARMPPNLALVTNFFTFHLLSVNQGEGKNRSPQPDDRMSPFFHYAARLG
jgi:hypothetical protein